MEIAAKTTSMFMLFLLIFVAGGIFLQIFFPDGRASGRGWSCRFCRSSILW